MDRSFQRMLFLLGVYKEKDIFVVIVVIIVIVIMII